MNENLIIELVDYLAEKGPGVIVSTLLNKYGEDAVFYLAITLLAWLRHYDSAQADQLILDRDDSIDHSTRQILLADLSSLFEVKGYSVSFSSDISSEIRRKVRDYVSSHYHPEDDLMD